MIGILIVTHGQFGRELLQTAQDIVGRQESAAAIAVTAETGIESLSRMLEEAARPYGGSEGILYLVDMLGGTPCNTALLKTRGANAEVVTGINLYMVISAFTHRSHLMLRALAEKVAEDGKRAITLPKDLLAKRTA